MRSQRRARIGEAKMYGTRREMMKLAAAAAGMASVGAWFAAAQDASQRDPSKTTPSGESPRDPKLDSQQAKSLLEQNQKDMKKNIERLFELASQLKDEVEKTDATTTLSIAMLRKTEEIEKLARSIRDRAKG